MSERRDIAEDLIGAVRKEAVGEVAKGVVKGVKAVLIAALGAICALAWSLWTANPVATVALAVVSLAFGMAVGAADGWRRAVSAKDAEISKLKNARRAHGALFDAFLELTHGEQLQIVSVWLSEPGGLAPTEDQRVQMGRWVAMKRLVRHDPVTDRLHLRDGVGKMLLENPQHVYDLMAARVADLADLSDRPTREEMDEAVENARREMSHRLEDAVRRAEEAEARVAKDEDESAKRRAKAESEVIGCVRSMGFYARKVIYRIMTEGPQTIDNDWLSAMEGAYFFDRITFKTMMKNHKSKVDMKPGIKAFLMEHPELFDEVREEVARELEERQRAESRVLVTGKPMSTGGRPVGGVVPAGMMTVASGLAESLNRAMKQMDRTPGTHDAEIAPLSGGESGFTAAAASASTAAAGGDPLAAILPAEAKLLLRVFDSGTVRLDDSTLPVAKSLADKGAIYRRDTHDSGVILNCDVMLSSDWVPVVRERANELRRAVVAGMRSTYPQEPGSDGMGAEGAV